MASSGERCLHVRPGGDQGLRRWGLRLLAAGIGALLTLAFPAAGAWWLGFVGLVPLVLVLRAAPSDREGLWLGLAAGAGFFAAIYHWLLPFVGVFALLFAVLLGLSWAPWGWLARRLLHGRLSAGRLAVALAVLPSVWVLTEYARSWDRLAGPWGLLGTSQWNVQPVLALAALGGVWGLSFMLALVNVALAAALVPGTVRRLRTAALGVAVAAVAGTLVAGMLRPEPEITGTLRVAGVQPGVIEDADDRVAAQVDLTEELTGEQPALVVWGQLSVPVDPASRPDVIAAIERAAGEVGAGVLVNVDERMDTEVFRTALLVEPDGPAARYQKTRLVPFGEYVPLRSLLEWVTGFTEAADVEIQRGDQEVLLDVDGVLVGPLISYESMFPDLRRRLAADGAQVTVVQGSTTSFQGTWAQPQQASVEAVRAVESGRSALLAQLSGVSSAFDPAGRELRWVGADETGAYVVDLPLAGGITPFTRYGDWVPAAAAVIVAGALVTHVLVRWLA
ncbi:MAG: apolipoprotein N-acyltransferase, partial [Nitriliruptorales bacterium]|nr:apolipoprotein N-acyltransferase [Nitriliruptorales bacterium]